MRPREYIQEFCGTPETEPRPILHRPLRLFGSLYATDGKILVCTEDDDSVAAGYDVAVSKAIVLIIREMEMAGPCIPVPRWMPEKLYDSGYQDWQTVRINSSWFRARYIEMIRDLPGVEISTNEHHPHGTAFFHFRGGWGALMPCSAPSTFSPIYRSESCAA